MSLKKKRKTLCSRACAFDKMRTKIRVSCRICATQFFCNPYAINNGGGKFCSRRCYDCSQKGRTAHNKGRQNPAMWGDKNPNWKGGHLHSRGYHVSSVCGGKSLTHRLVMEKHLGRRLNRNEVVHHIDGNKLNNMIENLQLTNRSDHAKIHHDFDLMNQIRRKKKITGVVRPCSSCGKHRPTVNAKRLLCESCYRGHIRKTFTAAEATVHFR